MKIVYLLFFSLLLIESSSAIFFPKKIWLYWDQIQLPSAIKINYQNIKQNGQKLGFEVHLLSDQNLHQFIDKRSFDQIQQKSTYGWRQNKADLVRLSVIQKHGGIYLDLSIMLFQGLQWLQSLQTNPDIINRDLQDNEVPQVLLFYNPLHGESDQYISNDKNQQFKYNLGYQSWFIAAKPNAKLIVQWKVKFIQFYQMHYLDIVNQIDRNGVYMADFGETAYFRVYYALYSVLKAKQTFFDQDMEFFAYKRTNVNQYFKIWAINCMTGPCLAKNIMNLDQQRVATTTLTKQQFQKKYSHGKQLRYFLKMPFTDYNFHSWYLRDQQKQSQKSLLQRYQQKKRKNPQKRCQNQIFYTQGSLYDKYLIKKQTTIHPKVTSLQQRSEFYTSCKYQIKNNKSYQTQLYLTITFILVCVGIALFRKQLKSESKYIKHTIQSVKISQGVNQHQQYFILVCLYGVMVALLTYYTFYWDLAHQKNSYFMLFAILIIIKLIRYTIDKQTSIHPFLINFSKQYTYTILQSIQCYCIFRNLLFLTINQNHLILFQTIFFCFFGYWIVKTIEKNSQHKQNKLFYDKLVLCLQGLYLNIAIGLVFSFAIYKNLRFFAIQEVYLSTYIRWIAIIYLVMLFFGLLIELLANRLKQSKNQAIKKPRTTSNFDKQKTLLMLVWVLYTFFTIKTLLFHRLALQSLRFPLQIIIIILFLNYNQTNQFPSKHKTFSSLLIIFLCGLLFISSWLYFKSGLSQEGKPWNSLIQGYLHAWIGVVAIVGGVSFVRWVNIHLALIV